MKSYLLIAFLTSNLLLFSQKSEFFIAESTQDRKIVKSNIVKINVSAVEKIILTNALYDSKKENLPYYLKNKTTSQSIRSTGQLKVKSTLVLDASSSEFIRKHFANYLSSEFQVKNHFVTISNETVNYCEIIPFKINALNQVVELVDYDLIWENSPQIQSKLTQQNLFTSTSILNSGKWYKIAITQDGIHKLDHNFFTKAGIDIDNVNPKNIRIYGNGGLMLAERNGEFRYDDLEENAIQVIGEGDNVFNTSDLVLFYAKNTTAWLRTNNYQSVLFTHRKNIYSDTAFYYLNFDIGPGKRVASASPSALTSNINTSSYDYYTFHENDITNFIKSGRNFYGEYFDITNSYNFTQTDNNFIIDDTIRIETTIAGRGSVDNLYKVTCNSINYNITCVGINIANYLGDYAALKTVAKKELNKTYNSITTTITKLTPNTVGYLDKFTINARRELTYNSNQFSFRDLRVAAPGNICNYNINANGNSNLRIWNVTNMLNPYEQQTNSSGSNLSFNASADSLNEYVVFKTDNVPVPTLYGSVINQNLHSVQQADYLIITPPELVPYANRLGVLHQNEEGLSYAVATTNQIYNEFSSGKIDASAIRDFIRMVYSRGNTIGKPTKYVLLLGRGSYYNRSGKIGNSNLIPTYETENSISLIYSIASDDFYGLMDPTEGYAAEGFGGMDVGIGRIIVSNASQADDVVKKIENYYKKGVLPTLNSNNCNTIESNEIFGDWRNHILFSADDGDGALHMSQADNLANKVKAASAAYNIDKVYIDAYKGLATPGGKRYPDMQAAFNSRVNKGCLVMNYTGHGGEVGLSAERIVDIPTINSWTNFNSLPLFITATCEFSRYDDPDRISAGELCLLNPKGGSIAMLTTCRLAFSNFNATLNDRVFDFIFKKNTPSNTMPTLGDIIKNTKASLGQNFFYSNFHLLGDPALTLAFPKQRVYTSHINGKAINSSVTDTIKGLSKVTIKGFVGDTTGTKISGFNGLVYPVIYDKGEMVVCQLNDVGSSIYTNSLVPFQFVSQQNIIYKGKAEVKNGDFTFSFIVPKDVSFNYGNAKFSYYATDGNYDANGNYDSVKVGGLDPNATIDTEGPQVKLFLNSRTFVNGGTTNENPILLADVIDSSGVNTVGTGFGHDITAVIDQNTNKPIVLNDYYESNLNSYQKGQVKYQLTDLSEGSHELTFKVWDVQNNSSTSTSDFIVAKNADLALNMVLNYPNPFTTQTKFFFEHNRNCEDIKVSIQIFTISGKLAKSIIKTINCEGFRNDGISWDGKDDYGDKLGRGVYLYKVAITDKDNKKAEKIEKLVILN